MAQSHPEKLNRANFCHRGLDGRLHIGLGSTMRHVLFAILVLLSGFWAEAKPIKVLFVGNSLTFMPDWQHPVVPGFVEKLTASQGREVKADSILYGGHTLENHWNLGEFQEAVAHNRYDFVIIQPFSIEALNLPGCFRKMGPWEPKPQDGPSGRKGFLEYAEKMIQMARANGATPMVFQPWIYQEGHPWLQPDFQCAKFEGTNDSWFGGSRTELQRRLNEGFQALKDRMHEKHGYSIRVLDIGGLWPKIPDSDLLYNIDHYHPTYYGSMLSALVISQALTGVPASRFQYTPEQLTPEQVKFLAQVAQGPVPSRNVFPPCQDVVAGALTAASN